MGQTYAIKACGQRRRRKVIRVEVSIDGKMRALEGRTEEPTEYGKYGAGARARWRWPTCGRT